jgi:hypothetical protein
MESRPAWEPIFKTEFGRCGGKRGAPPTTYRNSMNNKFPKTVAIRWPRTLHRTALVWSNLDGGLGGMSLIQRQFRRPPPDAGDIRRLTLGQSRERPCNPR